MQHKLSALLGTAALVFALASCEKEPAPQPEPETNPLATPVLSIAEQTETAFTISWEAVENAAGYTCIFQEDAPKTTTETSVSFSDLKAGKYTVKVKANAPADSEFTDSKYAEIAVTLEEAKPDLTFTITVSDLTATGALVTCTPSDNTAPYWFDVMSKADFDTFTSEDELMEQIISELEALGAEEGLSLEETLEVMLSVGEDTWTPTLTPATEYVVYAFGTDYDGTFTTGLTTYDFTSPESGEISPEMEKWIGSWSAVSTQTLTWKEEGEGLASEFTDEPMNFDLKIEADPNNAKQLLVYGWSHVDKEFPALAVVNDKGELEVYSGVAVGQASGGYTPTWTSYCSVEGESDNYFVSGNFPAYTFALNGEQAPGTRYVGSLQDERSFEVRNLEVYASSSQGFAIYGDSFPVYFPAGDISLTRQSAAGQLTTRPFIRPDRTLQAHPAAMQNVSAAR